jgi:hypothetical protein
MHGGLIFKRLFVFFVVLLMHMGIQLDAILLMHGGQQLTSSLASSLAVFGLC